MRKWVLRGTIFEKKWEVVEVPPRRSPKSGRKFEVVPPREASASQQESNKPESQPEPESQTEQEDMRLQVTAMPKTWVAQAAEESSQAVKEPAQAAEARRNGVMRNEARQCLGQMLEHFQTVTGWSMQDLAP